MGALEQMSGEEEVASVLQKVEEKIFEILGLMVFYFQEVEVAFSQLAVVDLSLKQTT